MKIAVLSGKGGTGKTLVSVNLAALEPHSTYIDCDVEEPNGFLFFYHQDSQATAISVKIPKVNPDLCSGCRKCVEFCNFNALAYIGGKVKVFEDICHSCGGCMLVCPENAISEIDHEIGRVEVGISEEVQVVTGMMNTGEATGIPIIKRVLESADSPMGDTIIDCPPGSACIVMESIKDADYCVLVAEPTIFGVHNLSMVHELVKLFEKPYGVVLNKSLESENPSEIYCKTNEIEILGRIPFDKVIGQLNSNGHILVRENEHYAEMFKSIKNQIKTSQTKTEAGNT